MDIAVRFFVIHANRYNIDKVSKDWKTPGGGVDSLLNLRSSYLVDHFVTFTFYNDMLGKVDGRESLKDEEGRDGDLVSVHDTYILYRLQVYRIIN